MFLRFFNFQIDNYSGTSEKGQVGTSTNVHYSEVVLYLVFLPITLYFTFYDILGRILLQCGYKVVCVRIIKILLVLEWIDEAETRFIYHLEQVYNSYLQNV